MNRSLEPALTGLIPTYNGALPTELLQLARSILAQSQSKAASLKPEEEAARSYVCAHLACDRLKQTLNLPPITARPPLPPRAYKKLYAYFDSAIPLRPPRHVNVSTNGTPNSSPMKNKTPMRTPSKITPLRTVTPQSKPGTLRRSRGIEDDEAPKWVMGAIRKVGNAFEARAAIPHVYAGVCSVLKFCESQNPVSVDSAAKDTPSRSRVQRSNGPSESLNPRGPIEEERIPGLIVTLFIYVYARLSGEQMSPEEYLRYSYKAIETLRTIGNLGDRSANDMKLDVNSFTREAQNGWLDLEWFQNIEPGAGVNVSRKSVHEDQEDDDDEIDGVKSHKRRRGGKTGAYADDMMGRGSMMQGQVNYWSEEARRDFMRWKKTIMKRVEQIEQRTE